MCFQLNKNCSNKLASQPPENLFNTFPHHMVSLFLICAQLSEEVIFISFSPFVTLPMCVQHHNPVLLLQTTCLEYCNYL